MQLKTLTYTSRAILDIREQDLVEILGVSRQMNALDGVTGLLIFNGTHFLQVIEGAQDAIDGLVARLRRDRRHTGLEIRDERIVEARSFPDWSMELVKVTARFQEACREIDRVLPDDLDALNRILIMQIVAAIGEPVTLPE